MKKLNISKRNIKHILPENYPNGKLKFQMKLELKFES